MKPQRRKKIKPFTKDKQVYMPLKKSTAKPLPKRSTNIFKKIQNKVQTPQHRKPLKLPKFTIYIILFIMLFGLSYLAVKYITYLRNADNKEKDQQYVTGLSNIPAYPDSIFIFEDSLNKDSVKNFLSKGGSAYRLPNNTNVTAVFDYYKTKLTNLGWTYIQFVNMEAKDKEYGQYWAKDNVGLRIYSKYNDVWYETISVTEAQTGLADKVKEETDMELLLVNDTAQDLLPDFPWILSIPKEYIISYKVSAYDSTLQQVLFSKIGSEEKVYLVPVGKVGKALDYCLDDYIATLNTTATEKWGVNNTYVISTNVGAGLKGTIGTNSTKDEIAVIPDSYNNIVYVIDSNVTDNSFVDYILTNIVAQKTTKDLY